MIANDTQCARLAELAEVVRTSKPNATTSQIVRSLCLHHEAAPLIGHVLLDALEEAGYGPEDFDVVQALDTDAALIGSAMLHASASRGLDLDVVLNEGHTCPDGLERDAKVILIAAAGVTPQLLIQMFNQDVLWGAQIVALATVFELDQTTCAEAAARDITIVKAVDETDKTGR